MLTKEDTKMTKNTYLVLSVVFRGAEPALGSRFFSEWSWSWPGCSVTEIGAGAGVGWINFSWSWSWAGAGTYLSAPSILRNLAFLLAIDICQSHVLGCARKKILDLNDILVCGAGPLLIVVFTRNISLYERSHHIILDLRHWLQRLGGPVYEKLVI